MKGLVEDIEDLTVENPGFRRVVCTGKHRRPVLMAPRAGEEIGVELHSGQDQSFRVEMSEGEGEVWMEGERTPIRRGGAIIVPAGAGHNIVNMRKGPLERHTFRAPPRHRDGLVRLTRADPAASNCPVRARLTAGTCPMTPGPCASSHACR